MASSWRRIGVALAAAAVPHVLFAQTAPPATPGLPTREEVQPPAPSAAEPSAASVRVDSAAAFAAAPCPLEGSALRVTITGVRYAPLGRDAITPAIQAVLDGVAPPPPGEQPIRVVCTIRDRANAALRGAGFIASVQIPPQEITGTTLELAVVTARLTEFRVRGEAGRHRAALARRLDQIRALDPLNERDIERLLLLAGDVPGLDVQLALRPAGTAPGDVIGELAVSSRRVAVFANLQNYGSRQLGRETVYVRGELYGLATGSDLLYVGGSASLDFEEQRVVQAGYATWLDDAGTTLGIRGVYAWSRPAIDRLDLRSESVIAGVDLTRPLIRSVRVNAVLSGGAELIEQRTKIFGGAEPAPLNRDKLRVAFARLSGSFRLPRFGGGDRLFVGGGIEVRQGLDILGASRDGSPPSSDGFTLSRFDGNPQATVVRGDLDTAVGLGPIFSLAGALRGQWSSDALLNLEEFSIGNLTIGRGYDPGSNTADRAIGTRAELRARLPFELPVGIELLGFFDSVWIWNRDRGTTENDRNLTSYGGGVAAQLPGRLALEVLYARPRDRALSFDAEPPPDRVLVSLTARFSPAVR